MLQPVVCFRSQILAGSPSDTLVWWFWCIYASWASQFLNFADALLGNFHFLCLKPVGCFENRICHVTVTDSSLLSLSSKPYPTVLYFPSLSLSEASLALRTCHGWEGLLHGGDVGQPGAGGARTGLPWWAPIKVPHPSLGPGLLPHPLLGRFGARLNWSSWRLLV